MVDGTLPTRPGVRPRGRPPGLTAGAPRSGMSAGRPCLPGPPTRNTEAPPARIGLAGLGVLRASDPQALRPSGVRRQASRIWPSRLTTGGSTDQGKLIQSSVYFQTYSHFTDDCGFS